MPLGAIIPAAIGAVSSAFGRSGNQGGVNQNTHQVVDSTSKYNGTTSGYQQAVEDPSFGQFRNDLIPLLKNELHKAQLPIFGDAQKAAYLNDLNGLAKSSIESLKSNLAGVGGLNAGRLAAGATDIQRQRFGNYASFLGTLPFQEEQARSARVGNLMGMATNWVGRAPISYLTGGTQSGTEDKHSVEDGTSQSQQQGAPWWKNLLNTAGGVLGDYAAGKWNSGNNADYTKLPINNGNMMQPWDVYKGYPLSLP